MVILLFARLQKNVKPAYLDAIWTVINWKEAEARLSKA